MILGQIELKHFFIIYLNDFVNSHQTIDALNHPKLRPEYSLRYIYIYISSKIVMLKLDTEASE